MVDRSSINEAIKAAARKGLNVFASAPTDSLPKEIQQALKKSIAELEKYHSIGIFAHGGRTLWENLEKPVIEFNHPVDNLSIKVWQEFAHRALPNAENYLLYPHDSLIAPLQKLGRYLKISFPSPLGLDINSEFGPWFAFRIAFLTTERLPSIVGTSVNSPCSNCADKPCLKTCPAGATGYDFRIQSCADYRFSENSKCGDRCLARIACPYKSEHKYSEEQIRYHMLRPNHLKRLGDFRSGK